MRPALLVLLLCGHALALPYGFTVRQQVPDGGADSNLGTSEDSGIKNTSSAADKSEKGAGDVKGLGSFLQSAADKIGLGGFLGNKKKNPVTEDKPAEPPVETPDKESVIEAKPGARSMEDAKGLGSLLGGAANAVLSGAGNLAHHGGSVVDGAISSAANTVTGLVSKPVATVTGTVGSGPYKKESPEEVKPVASSLDSVKKSVPILKESSAELKPIPSSLEGENESAPISKGSLEEISPVVSSLMNSKESVPVGKESSEELKPVARSLEGEKESSEVSKPAASSIEGPKGLTPHSDGTVNTELLGAGNIAKVEGSVVDKSAINKVSDLVSKYAAPAAGPVATSVEKESSAEMKPAAGTHEEAKGLGSLVGGALNSAFSGIGSGVQTAGSLVDGVWTSTVDKVTDVVSKPAATLAGAKPYKKESLEEAKPTFLAKPAASWS